MTIFQCSIRRSDNTDLIVFLLHPYDSIVCCVGRRGRDRMVVGFINYLCNLGISPLTCLGEVYQIQHYVIKVVSDLRQVGGFLWVLQFPPPIKLTTTI